MRVLVTGSAGFIAGYLVQELLESGYQVTGLDNYCKYGQVKKSYQHHPNYFFILGEASDVDLMKRLALDCDYMIACAARMGGISYLHEYAYDLLAENERIVAATFDAAINAFHAGRLKKIVVLSSSMVFENAAAFPTPENHLAECPPPSSTYGFQKLSCEYFARGAHEQYGLPYTIVRPFNCVGIGEGRALNSKEIPSGNVTLAMSHVVPDVVQKVARGQNPLHLLGSGNQVRHYTYGGDLAKGIRICMEHPAALNDDFNISTPKATTVLELAELIWRKINGSLPFSYVSDPPYKYDVQLRSPDVTKAREKLGFEATTSLGQMLDEVIPWIKRAIELGTI
ncbi:MAG: NAD(P)-dependent oxidoreductase [Deltaproteobacteria bacterium]|nr:NAD(P)-dependent oxidoreductase [Deltaproteobacteria bacterium]